MLDRTNDWEPLDRTRFAYLNRRAGPGLKPAGPLRGPEPELRPVPVDRVIRAMRRAID